MTRRLKVVRFVCSDPRFNFNFDLQAGDKIIPFPGVILGSSEMLAKKIANLPDFESSLFMFNPHSPCAAVPDPQKALKMGHDYAYGLQRKKGIRSISLFLGENAIHLNDPLHDGLYYYKSEEEDNSIKDITVSRLFEEAAYSQRRRYDKNLRFEVKKIAIAPFFTKDDMEDGTLYISSEFFNGRALRVIKNMIISYVAQTTERFPPLEFAFGVDIITRACFETFFLSEKTRSESDIILPEFNYSPATATALAP